MEDRHDRLYGDSDVRGSVALQMFVFLGGPLAWVGQLILSYFVIAVGCDVWGAVAVQVLLYLISIGALVIAGIAGLLSFRAMEGSARDEGVMLEGPDDRASFMAAIGVATSLLFVAVILMSAVAVVLISPCS